MTNGKRVVLALSAVLVAVAGVGTGWVVRGPGDSPAPVVSTDAKVLARCREAVEQAREGFALADEAEKTDEAGREEERKVGGDLFEHAKRRSETSAQQRSV